MAPPILKSSLDGLSSQQKLSVEKSVNRAGRKPVNLILKFTGRVEKILSGSISDLDTGQRDQVD